MSQDRTLAARTARLDDRTALAALGVGARPEMAEVTVVERSGIVVGAAILDPAGPPTEPGVPLLETVWSRAATDLERLCLMRFVLARASAAGCARVLTGADPMDHAGLTLLEQVGFRPTGRGPYLPLGAGAVQYISGYQDAAGSTIDLEFTAGGSAT